jgi:hypothetical protein
VLCRALYNSKNLNLGLRDGAASFVEFHNQAGGRFQPVQYHFHEEIPMRFIKLACLSLSGLSLLLVGASASASPIQVFPPVITVGSPVQVPNYGTAPGSPTNYDFKDFGGGNQPTLLTDYTVSTAGDSQFPGNSLYTILYAPDGSGPFYAGIAYDPYNPGGTSLIATFSISADGSFTVYVLDGNTDNILVGNTSVGLGVNGGAAVTVTTFLYGGNDFTAFNVVGAKTTDLFQVYATGAPGDGPSIGGLTFSNISPVPEPSTLTFGLLGLTGGVALIRRRPAPKA